MKIYRNNQQKNQLIIRTAFNQKVQNLNQIAFISDQNNQFNFIKAIKSCHLNIFILLNLILMAGKKRRRLNSSRNSSRNRMRKVVDEARVEDEVELCDEEIGDSAKAKQRDPHKMQRQINRQIRQLSKSKGVAFSKDKPQDMGRKIPCTDIPYRHFKAMLKKDFINWRRNYRRSIMEIVFPMLVFVVLSAIRLSIQPSQQPYGRDIERHSAILMPMPDGARMGLTTPENSRNFTVQAILGNHLEMGPFYKFHNFDDAGALASNQFGKFLADNCEATDYHSARRKWAIIGDLENSGIVQELKYDIENFVFTRQHGDDMIREFMKTQGAALGYDPNAIETNPLYNFRSWIILEEQPLVFKGHDDLMDYILQDGYQVDEDKPGICFGVQVQENIGTEDAKMNGPYVNVTMYYETLEGRTPAQGRSWHENTTSQKNIASTANDAFDKYEKNPDIRSGEMYFRQGYSFIHNWAANAALRNITGEKQASIVQSLIPALIYDVVKDDFENVLKSIYSYIAIIIYILPMYSYILRQQIDKQSGIKRHLAVIGLSTSAQNLAMFVSYTVQVTLITIGITLTMYFGGLFKKSFAQSPFLLFMFTWVQGVSNFGFIVMISSLLPQQMYPKLAAKWGSLLYFGSTFADFTIQKPGINEQTKTIMSMIFPTLATARASRNLCLFEYIPGGSGLNWHDTLWVRYQNYRIITYYMVMVLAFFLHLSIGLLFEKYGSVPEILKNLKVAIFGRNRDEFEMTKHERDMKTDYDNFEDDKELMEANGDEDVLDISNLVKRFRQSADDVSGGDKGCKDEEKSKYFTAVNNLSLTLYKSEIFALLGHNGAGKTTTISMLTGMLEATAGQVSCFNRKLIDENADRDQLKQDIEFVQNYTGICPQHDILFDSLTVQEHLDIFCDFKGVDPATKQAKIDKIMKDVDVWDHRDTVSQALSGGNKRKLSVALALVADSKLVLLDEPTSGMDLTARRRLWDMLKDYKQDRIVILTTHNMDEADLLGDRVGIMSGGRLVCLGTSAFLKNRYGYGYKIQVMKEDNAKQSFEHFSDQVYACLKEQLGPEVRFLSEDAREVSFQAPKAYSSRFKDFFDMFDKKINMVKLGVKSYRISVTSLEEVFLRVGDLDHVSQPSTRKQRGAVASSPRGGAAASPGGSGDAPLVVTGDLSSQIDSYRQNRQFGGILKTQLKSICARRAQAMRRSALSVLFELSVPIILVFVGLCFTKVEFLIHSPPRQLGPQMYPWKQRITLNEDLVVKDSKYAKPTGDSEEDFDDDHTADNFSSDNLNPLDIMKMMPSYDADAYKLETFRIFDDMNMTDAQDIMETIKPKRESMKCSREEQDDKRDSNRVSRCSLMDNCLNSGTMDWDNSLCINSESCAFWTTGDAPDYHSGCILTKYCGLKAQYGGLETAFECPAGPNVAGQGEQVTKEQEQVWMFKHFNDRLYDTAIPEDNHNKGLDMMDYKDGVYPYRYGAYLFYEANNRTKKFKVANYVNLTSQDAVGVFPQLMYESLLRASTGNPKLNFNVTTHPFPPLKLNHGQDEAASGIFVCFVVGVGFALIPASIVSRIVHEKESGLRHMQVVSGLDKRAYWLSFLLFDIIVTYIPCLITMQFWDLFGLRYKNMEKVLAVYPWGIVPYSYAMSNIFNRESTAQTFTIYWHFLISGIAGMIVFALRMVEATAFWGDRIMWIVRFVSPSFNLCNAIIYASSLNILKQQREEVRNDIKNKYGHYANFADFFPEPIHTGEPMSPANIGGDVYMILFHGVFWLVVVVLIERSRTGLYETLISCRKLPEPKSEDEIKMDEDVYQEEKRVQMRCKDSYVAVNKFRKVYRVPFGKPILAVEKASFAVDKGECFALLGVNGAGKSTTFKSLTNVVAPTGGSITIQGRDVAQDFNEVRHKIGYCPQQNALFFNLTVQEHLHFFAELKGLPHNLHNLLIKAALQKLNIQKYANKPAQQLSGGNKRKLQVAIAILGNPQIILLDEPSAGMDPAAKRFMWQVVSSITSDQKNTCTILTTHSMEEAEALSSKMGIMVKGGIFTCFGGAQHIKDKFGSGYEIELKMQKVDASRLQLLAKQLGIQNADDESAHFASELVSTAIDKKMLSAEMQEDFENSMLKILYSINSHNMNILGVKLTISEFSKLINCYLSLHYIIKMFVKEFGRVEVLESHGDEYFKLRVPRQGKTIGFIFGLLEGLKSIQIEGQDQTASCSIQEYSVGQTTLEMIFNHFAQGGNKEDSQPDAPDSTQNQSPTTSSKQQLVTYEQGTSKDLEVTRIENGHIKKCSAPLNDRCLENTYKDHSDMK